MVAERAVEHVCQRADHVTEIERFGVQRLAPPEGEEPLCQIGALLRRRHDELGGGLELRVVDFIEQDLRIAEDDGQEIVEVVGDAAGQMPERFHLLRLPELQLHLDALRLIGEDADEMRGGAVRVADRRDRQAIPEARCRPCDS